MPCADLHGSPALPDLALHLCLSQDRMEGQQLATAPVLKPHTAAADSWVLVNDAGLCVNNTCLFRLDVAAPVPLCKALAAHGGFTQSAAVVTGLPDM